MLYNSGYIVRVGLVTHGKIGKIKYHISQISSLILNSNILKRF